jgi:hypothetical protein
MMVLIPAYGRDYKNQVDAYKDFNDNKDFRVCSVTDDGYTNREDLLTAGVTRVKIRFNNQRRSFFADVRPNPR